MPKRSEFVEYLLEALWSQWHELGVASTVPRRHDDDVLDPEALIAFTAVHSDLDPRLRDESIDWVLRYGTYLSRVRLKNVLTTWELSNTPPFLEYAATVNEHSQLGWPAGSAEPLAFRSRARALLEDLGRPALLSLRIRALAGVGARAELLRALLSRPQTAPTAADLAAETSYTKRNVLNELEPLQMAGLVKSFRAVNADRYSLAKTDELVALFGPVPPRSTRWIPVLRVFHLLLDVEQMRDRSPLQQAVEAARIVESHRDLFAAAEMYPPQTSGTATWNVLLGWAVGQAKALARV